MIENPKLEDVMIVTFSRKETRVEFDRVHCLVMTVVFELQETLRSL